MKILFNQSRILGSGRSDQGGFTLLEMAIVLILIGTLFSGAVLSVPRYMAKQRSDVTQQRFELALNALSTYSQRHFRLPCPADTDGANRGLERGGGKCFENNTDSNLYTRTQGVLPWRELGLAESDVMDGWGNYITYKPAPQLTVNTYDKDMQGSDSADGAEIHNACRNQVWYDAGKNHLNRQKALFCCNAHPKDAYLTNAQPNSSLTNRDNKAPGNWRNIAVVMDGTMTNNAVGNTANVAFTNAWVDNYKNTDTAAGSGGLYISGAFDTPFDTNADAPLIRASSEAVTLISHGGNGYFSFMRKQASTARENATVSGTNAPVTATGITVSADEQRNVWPPEVFAAAIPHPKSNDVAGALVFDPFGMQRGAGDDLVVYQRSDELFARAGTSTCNRPARTDAPYSCPLFAYGNYMYVLDQSSSMTAVDFTPDPTKPGTKISRWDAVSRALLGGKNKATASYDNSIMAPNLNAEIANKKDPNMIGFTMLTAGTVTTDNLLNYNATTKAANQVITPPTDGSAVPPDKTTSTSVFSDIVNDVGNQKPTGNTPLFNTILRSAALIGNGSGVYHPNGILVLSDGDDNDSNFPKPSSTSTSAQKTSAISVLNTLTKAGGLYKLTEPDDLRSKINGAPGNHFQIPTREEILGLVLQKNYPFLRVNIVDVGDGENTHMISDTTGGSFLHANSQSELDSYAKSFANHCIGSS